MKSCDLAWAAGLFEGEGSFCEQRMLKYPNRIILRENIN